MRRKWDEESVKALVKRREDWTGDFKSFYQKENVSQEHFNQLKRRYIAGNAKKGFIKVPIKSTRPHEKGIVRLRLSNGIIWEFPSAVLDNPSQLKIINSIFSIND